MNFQLEVDQWPVLDGQLSIHNYANYDTWYDPDAASYSPVTSHVTIESLGGNWQYSDGMEAVQSVKRFEALHSDAMMYTETSEQHVNDCLPTAFEEDSISDQDMRQILPLLHSPNGPGVIDSMAFGVHAMMVPSSPEQKHGFIQLSLPAQWPTVPEMMIEGTTLSDISVSANIEDGNVMDFLSQLCDTVDGDMIVDQAVLAASYPSLPLVSPEDIDSLLSSGSWSTNSSVSASDSLFGNIVQPPNSPMSDSESVSSSESSLFLPPVEKKQRKKEQNKTAALRYRQKKRSEQGSVMTECEDLEKRNTELKTKVSEMMKEITYLKGLIDEIDA